MVSLKCNIFYLNMFKLDGDVEVLVITMGMVCGANGEF